MIAFFCLIMITRVQVLAEVTSQPLDSLKGCALSEVIHILDLDTRTPFFTAKDAAILSGIVLRDGKKHAYWIQVEDNNFVTPGMHCDLSDEEFEENKQGFLKKIIDIKSTSIFPLSINDFFKNLEPWLGADFHKITTALKLEVEYASCTEEDPVLCARLLDALGMPFYLKVDCNNLGVKLPERRQLDPLLSKEKRREHFEQQDRELIKILAHCKIISAKGSIPFLWFDDNAVRSWLDNIIQESADFDSYCDTWNSIAALTLRHSSGTKFYFGFDLPCQESDPKRQISELIMHTLNYADYTVQLSE